MFLKIEKRANAIKQLDKEHSRFIRARELLLSGKMANTKDQRRLKGLISPANLIFKETGFEIKQYGLAMKLIFHS